MGDAVTRLGALLAGMLVVSTARAADELPEVVVTAPRESAETQGVDATAFATVIDTADAPATVVTLSEALAETAGVQVRRFGGLGDFSTVSVRGFSPGQVQVYLDGIPLSRADDEAIDLSELPLDAVERVEVYRGTSPVAFAQSAPGGVVNVVTRRAGAEPLTAASLSWGSFDTRKVDVVHARRSGAWDGLVFAHYLGSTGDFDFDLERDPDDRRDDGTYRRENNAFDGGSLTARVGWQPPGAPWRLAFTSDTFARGQGVPGRVPDEPGVPDPPAQSQDARRRVVRQLGRFDALGMPMARLPITADLGAWLVYEDRRFEVPAGDPVFVRTDATDRALAGGAQALVRGAFGAGHLPTLLLAASRDSLAQRNGVPVYPTLRAGAAPDKVRWRTTVAAEDEVLLFDERLAVVPRLRWEWFRDDFPGDPRTIGALREGSVRVRNVVAPHFGVRATVAPGLALLGNVGHYTRVPNLQELFGTSGVVQGQPDLRPETSLNGDVGLRWVLPRAVGPLATASVAYAWFQNSVDDLIVLVPASVSVFRPQNVASARVRGHEVAATARLWDRLAVTLNYTHQDARDTSGIPGLDGNRLPGRPADEGYVRGELDWSRARPLPVGAWATRLWPGRLFWDLEAIGDNTLDRADTVRVGSRFYHGVGLELGLPVADLRLTVEAKNVTDDQTRDALDFPLPGRTLFVTLAWGFGRRR